MKLFIIITVFSAVAVIVPFVSFAIPFTVPFPDNWEWPFPPDYPSVPSIPPSFPASEEYAQLDEGDRNRWYKEKAKRDRAAAKMKQRSIEAGEEATAARGESARGEAEKKPPHKIPDIIPFSVLMNADNVDSAAVQNLAHEGLVLLGRALYDEKIKNLDVHGEHIFRAGIIPGGPEEYTIRMFGNHIGSTYDNIQKPSSKKGARPNQFPSISSDMLTLLQSELQSKTIPRIKMGSVINLPLGGEQIKDQNRFAEFWQSDVGGAGYIETGISRRSLPILLPFGVSSDRSCFSFILNFNTHSKVTWSGKRFDVGKISVGKFGSDTMFIACDTNHDKNFDTITFHIIGRDGITPLPVSEAKDLLKHGSEKGYFLNWRKGLFGVHHVDFASDPKPPPLPPPPYQGHRMKPKR